MKIVFLDFDGVLNGDRYLRTQVLSATRPALDPVCCERVQRLCDLTGAQLVISSSWREIRAWDEELEATRGPRDLEEIRGWLREAGITAPVIGATNGQQYRICVRENRAQQIIVWAQRSLVTRWVALDDFRMLDLQGRGIQTSAEHGIREADVSLAMSMLGTVDETRAVGS